jgi:hypothetical protein
MANDDKEIDRMAREGGKSEWQERSAPAAGDPVTDAERKGLNLLGQSDPRGDGSLWGVGDPNGGDVGASDPVSAPPGGRRTNPPLVEDAGMGDGGIDASGGVAGGA